MQNLNDFFLLIRSYNVQWTAVVAIMVILWCWYYVRPNFGLMPAIVFGVCSLSSVWVWLPDNNRYAQIDNYTQTALKLFAADSIGKIFIILIPMMVFAKDMQRFFRVGYLTSLWFAIINSILTLIGVFIACWRIPDGCTGLIGNPSIGMGVTAAMLPIIVRSKRRDWWLISLVGSAAFISQSSIAIGVFGLYLLFSFRGRQLAYLLVAGAFFSPIVLNYYGLELFNDSERFKIWRFMLERWAAPHNLLFGTGLGTYHVFSINLQKYATEHYPGLHIGTLFWWNTFHNDFLQMFFECGIVGGLSTIFAYIVSLRGAFYSDRALGVAVLLFGCYMLLNPALHNPIPVLYGSFLFVYVLRRYPTNKERI